jgi:hypothetical protein
MHLAHDLEGTMISSTRMAALAVTAMIGAGGLAGGWAVTTVENPPLSLTAGGSYRIEFTVRQHGRTLLDDLHPVVRVLDASEGREGALTEVAAAGTGQPGRYAATIRVPQADSLQLVVASGFGRGRLAELTLMPVPVVSSGDRSPSLTPAEYGRRLFVAKGCGTCHLNGDVPEWARWNESLNLAPELTGRRLEASYVRQRLTNPGSLPPIGSGNLRMPQLGLADREVDALVELITGATVASTK